MPHRVELVEDGRILRIVRDGAAPMRFHALWLWDAAPDAATRDARNGQKLITCADWPLEARIAEARVTDNGVALRFAGEDRVVDYPLAYLEAHAYDRPEAGSIEPGRLPEGAEAWDGRLAPHSDSIARLERDPAALQDWLAAVRRWGFACVSGLEPAPGQLFRIVDLFGHVRQTNYGRHFEVRTEVNPVNLAYTGLGLQAHTDNPYRDPVPTLQILACIENSAQGGDSQVVDGFAAARRLLAEDRAAFDLLARHRVHFAFEGAQGVALHARAPMIELWPDGELRCIRFNARSSQPADDVPFDDMPAFLAAWRRFSEIIDDPGMAVSFKLAPGEAFIVDNTRVLHARTGYSGAGNRWLQGCYADKDGLLSTLASLKAAAGGQP